MINEKGQLFGRINIFDFTVVILLLLLVFGGGYKLFALDKEKAENTRAVTFDFLAEGVRDVTAAAFIVGEEIYDYDTKGKLGIVTAVRKEPSKRQFTTLDGQVLNVPMENRYDVYVTIDATGILHNGTLYVEKTIVTDGSDCHATTLKTNCIGLFKNIIIK